MDTPEMNNDKRLKVYEIGYLLLPSIAEEQLDAEVKNIKAVIEKNEGSFITEDAPKLRALAYAMKKGATGHNLKYDKGYFGWIKFEVEGSVIPTIQKELDKNVNILRSMIIGTVRENTMYTQKPAYQPDAEVSAEGKTEDVKEINEEEIDKTIENLVVE